MTDQLSFLLGNIVTGLRDGPDALIGQYKENDGRSAKKRAAYAGNPQAYFRDVFKWHLTPDQEEALEIIEEYDRVLIPAGNNTGKTFLLSGYAIYRMDAVASIPDEERGLDEQGAQVLLPGPDHATIFSTIYASIMEHANRAESNGFKMPGNRSERSVHWRVRPRWQIESFAPSFRIGQEVTHSASGRHHKNQVALVEEGQGVEEALWKAVEGMCSSEGNKIISAFNPTEPIGPAYQRAEKGGYHVFHINALNHPNVRGRSVVVPDAISYKVVDARVRKECRDRGSKSTTPMDSTMGDFVYALPLSLDSREIGPRGDGVLGHPDGTPHVFRPNTQFEAQVLGEWPSSSDKGLFDPGAWDRSVHRWRDGLDPADAPDVVGVDVARFGDDETCAAPSWGESANSLIRDYSDAEREGSESVLREMLETRRVRVGEILSCPKGDGPTNALWLHRRFPDSPFNLDESGVGASVLDHLNHVLLRQSFGVSFAGAVVERLPGEPVCENNRAAMYVRAATLVRLGLVDVPDDILLREEVMAHELVHSSRVVKISKYRKERLPSVRILEKDQIKKSIGRSPDRADCFVLSLFQPKLEQKWEIV